MMLLTLLPQNVLMSVYKQYENKFECFVDYICPRTGKLNASPWAVKKINSKCVAKQMDVYQKRLSEEAKLLKGINHPNIVGKT